MADCLSNALVTICRWSPQPSASLNTLKEPDSWHMGACRARPTQYELLDNVQGHFYKPEPHTLSRPLPPAPNHPSSLPRNVWTTLLSDVGKISRDGERRPSDLSPGRSKTSFSTKRSKVEFLPRNLPHLRPPRSHAALD